MKAILSINCDATGRIRLEEKLRHDAAHDALTDLPNRRFFLSYLNRALARLRRQEGAVIALLYLEVERLSRVNESLGYQTGDQLLVAFARRLETFVREADLVAHVQGKSFVVLLNDIKDISDATRVAERIQDEMTTPFYVGGYELDLSVRIGVVTSAGQHESAQQLFQEAQGALPRTGESGLRRHRIYDDRMADLALRRLHLETEMRRGLASDEFLLHYQPIISLASGHVVGFEALVRWEHPHEGLVPPGQFIPVAEETGLILTLGAWILCEACRQARRWEEEGLDGEAWSISVNLSAQQVRQPNFTREVVQILEEVGLAPSRLKLELTESILMEEWEDGSDVLRELNNYGVSWAIDDSGTGYSSLAYLQKLPVDTLKIDRSFVAPCGGVCRGERALAILQAINTLGKALGHQVIAEGVETNDQVECLRSLGCEQVQGYYFTRPLPYESAGALLSHAFPLPRHVRAA